MKSNIALQNSLIFANVGQKVWYAAHVLKSALTSSPAVPVRTASPAVVGKRAIPAYAGFVAAPAVTALSNTTGYAAGERFPGRPAVAAQAASGGYAAVAAIPALAASPAYAIGVAVPAYPAVAARAAQAEVLPVAAVTAVTSPAVTAIKGYEDAIEITKTLTELTVTAELPVYSGVGVVGSSLLKIGEITPSALQANAWVDTKAFEGSLCNSPDADLATDTLEQMLYRNALLCTNTITDIIRDVNGVNIPCKRLVITLYPDTGFDINSASAQLDKVKVAA
jgi:hypothetical protein